MAMTVNSVAVNLEIYFYFRAFQIFGLCPTSLHCHGSRTVQSRSCRHYIVNGCYIAFGTGLSYIIMYENLADFLDFDEKLGASMDFLTLVMLVLGYLVIYIESLIRRNDTVCILEKLFLLQSQREPCHWWTYKRLYSISIFSFLLIVLANILYNIDIANDFGASWPFSCGYIFLNVLCFVRLIQLIGFIELMRLEIGILRRRAIQMKFQYGFQVPSHQIQLLAVAYEIIYEISERVQRSTSWSVKVILLQFYFKLVICAYWVYWELYNHRPITESNFVLLNFFQLFVFLSLTRGFESKVNLFLHTICRLPNDVEDLKAAQRINALILQIKHQNITFDANGVFPLNRKIVKTILGTIATYLLFYVQFMEKFKSIF